MDIEEIKVFIFIKLNYEIEVNYFKLYSKYEWEIYWIYFVIINKLIVITYSFYFISMFTLGQSYVTKILNIII